MNKFISVCGVLSENMEPFILGGYDTFEKAQERLMEPLSQMQRDKYLFFVYELEQTEKFTLAKQLTQVFLDHDKKPKTIRVANLWNAKLFPNVPAPQVLSGYMEAQFDKAFYRSVAGSYHYHDVVNDNRFLCHCCGLNNAQNEKRTVMLNFTPLTSAGVFLIRVCDDCMNAFYCRCNRCERAGEIRRTIFQFKEPMREDILICYFCIPKKSAFCNECHCIYHYGDSFPAVSPLCFECQAKRRTTIHNYSHKPKPIFKGEGPIYYGIELEIELIRQLDKRKGAMKVGEVFQDDFVYLKNDGSLNNGFEIVTHPASIQVHKEKWKKFFDAKLEKIGFVAYPTGNCGMHIHVSRKTLLSKQLKNIIVFMNTAKNRNLIYNVSRRIDSRYAIARETSLSNCSVADEGKYNIVNINPQDTIEFRAFRGTLREESFFRSLEFTEALIEYSKNTELLDRNLKNPVEFGDFVLERKELYPNLAKIFPEGALLPLDSVIVNEV